MNSYKAPLISLNTPHPAKLTQSPLVHNAQAREGTWPSFSRRPLRSTPACYTAVHLPQYIIGNTMCKKKRIADSKKELYSVAVVIKHL